MTTTPAKKCCHEKWRGFGFSPRRCDKAAKVERDGNPYCGLHDPEKVAARRAERNAKWDRKWAVQTAAREQEASRAELQRLAGIPHLTNDELRAIVAAGGIRAVLAAMGTGETLS